MKWIVGLLCAIAVTFKVAAAQVAMLDVVISIEISQSRAHEGDNITAICRVEGMPSDGFIYWYKQVTDGDEQASVELIATDSSSLPPYSTFPRYQFKSEVLGNIKEFILIISNITYMDAGHIGCSYKDLSENIYQSQMLEVFKNVDRFEVHTNGTRAMANITGSENDTMDLSFVVGGSLPSPVVAVRLGEDDITEDFVVQDHVELLCDGSIGKTCPLHYVQHAELTGRRLSLHNVPDRTNLTLTAYVPGSGFRRVQYVMPIYVIRAPMFECESQTWGKLDAGRFEVSCIVHARPAPTMYLWTWMEDEVAMRVNPDLYATTGEFDANVETIEDGTTKVTLTFDRLTNKRLQMYHLFVMNEIGNSTTSILVNKDNSIDIPEAEGDTDCATTNMTSLLVVLLGAMLASLW